MTILFAKNRQNNKRQSNNWQSDNRQSNFRKSKQDKIIGDGKKHARNIFKNLFFMEKNLSWLINLLFFHKHLITMLVFGAYFF